MSNLLPIDEQYSQKVPGNSYVPRVTTPMRLGREERARTRCRVRLPRSHRAEMYTIGIVVRPASCKYIFQYSKANSSRRRALDHHEQIFRWVHLEIFNLEISVINSPFLPFNPAKFGRQLHENDRVQRPQLGEYTSIELPFHVLRHCDLFS